MPLEVPKIFAQLGLNKILKIDQVYLLIDVTYSFLTLKKRLQVGLKMQSLRVHRLKLNKFNFENVLSAMCKP